MLLSALASTLLALAAPASAAIFTARPANSTIGRGGEEFTLKWMDDGKAPSLADIGVTRIDLCVGGRTHNAVVQEITPGVDLGKQANITFTVNPSAGENGQYYLFKYTSASNNVVDGKAYEQFSARFFMQNMTGSFSSEQSALIAVATSGSIQQQPTQAVANTVSVSKPAAASASASASASKGSGAEQLAVPAALAVAAGAVAYLA
ncbi:hypothetical protein Q8F55_006426 [Vanrija albida]|uniref:Yeast cell wall synthesis Kre9/Knh1-like N-terminal domain-containing protein n=1 Tax=Vanrija albida TaxID=181172 RepID=A0ABR3PY12_9TREE